MDKEEVLERWAEYVEELYRDGNRGDADMGDLVNVVYMISSEEIETVIKELPKERLVVVTILQQNCYKVWERKL